MTLRTLMLARSHKAPISSHARLTMLALADICDDAGFLSSGVDLSVIAQWTHLDDSTGRSAVAELFDLGILHVETSIPVMDGMAWLTIIDGWVDSWSGIVWRHGEVVRQNLPIAIRRAVMERDGGACQWCGSMEDPQVDHIHPVSRGGLTVVSNLQVLCRRHNIAKGAFLPEVSS